MIIEYSFHLIDPFRAKWPNPLVGYTHPPCCYDVNMHFQPVSELSEHTLRESDSVHIIDCETWGHNVSNFRGSYTKFIFFRWIFERSNLVAIDGITSNMQPRAPVYQFLIHLHIIVLDQRNIICLMSDNELLNSSTRHPVTSSCNGSS